MKKSTVKIDGDERGAIASIRNTINKLDEAGKSTAVFGKSSKRDLGQFTSGLINATGSTSKFTGQLSNLAAGLATGGFIGAAFAGATALIGLLSESNNKWNAALEKSAGSLIRVKDNLEGLTFDFKFDEAVAGIDQLQRKIDELKAVSIREALQLGGQDFANIKQILNEIGLWTSEELDLNTKLKEELEKQVEELKVKAQLADIIAKTQGFENAEAKKFFDAQQKFAEEGKKHAEDREKEIKKQQQEWTNLNSLLSRDIARSTLPEISFKIFEIDQRFSEYAKKFPDHINQIKIWRETMVAAALDLQNAQAMSLETFKPPETFDIQPMNIDVEAMKALHDQQIEESTRVTTAELANLALREGAFNDMLGNMSDAFMDFANVSKNTNKTLFGISKAFAIAEAGVATYLAATKALAEVPFPFNFAAAASVIAAGIGNIARIASMQPGSTAGGGAPSAPPIPGRETTNVNSGNRNFNYQINFYGDFSGDKDRLARDIIDSLNKATEDGLILNTSGRG